MRHVPTRPRALSPAVVLPQQLEHVHLSQQRQQPLGVKQVAEALGVPRYEVLGADHQSAPRGRQPGHEFRAGPWGCQSIERQGGFWGCYLPASSRHMTPRKKQSANITRIQTMGLRSLTAALLTWFDCFQLR